MSLAGTSRQVEWPASLGGRGQDGARRDPPVTYSANGKIVGIAYCLRDNSYFPICDASSEIFICDVSSGILMHSHSLDNTALLSNRIWTHGESLRFATTDVTTITIWEVQFTSGATPTEVETLPAPDDFSDKFCLLDPSRLVFAYWHCYWHQIWLWDARNSKYLLKCTDAEFKSATSFSSNGRFFTYTTTKSEICLWKDTPTGYVLLGTVESSGYPLLSGNGESIVAHSGCAIQLWRTRSFTATPPGVLTRAPRYPVDFIVEFSPDETLALVAEQDRSEVTVLNLKSGVPQLTIDTGMGVYGLGVIGNTAVFIGLPKVIFWDLPAGDCIPHARVGLRDSSRTITLDGWVSDRVTGASVSPDSRCVALITMSVASDITLYDLHIYNASTGEYLGREGLLNHTPRFSPDGRDVWCVDQGGKVGVWRVGVGQVLEGLGSPVDMEHPPEGNPWGSSRGYRVTNDWWVLSSGGKRLLMLPPPWRSYAVDRVWKGRFLALLHRGLSEPVILELEVNRDP